MACWCFLKSVCGGRVSLWLPFLPLGGQGVLNSPSPCLALIHHPLLSSQASKAHGSYQWQRFVYVGYKCSSLNYGRLWIMWDLE